MSTVSCPDCGAPLTGAPTCNECQLPVLGPTAARLWQVDQRLAAVAAESAALRDERVRLLALLRSGQTAAVPAGATYFPPPGTFPPAGAAPRKETSPQQVQNTLLGLGALLLALAGLVFAAVTYRHLGVVGRALVLLALTGIAAAVPAWLVRRGLTASAEAVTAVALVLSAVDAWAVRRAGLGDGLDERTYTAIATAVLAALAAGHALTVPVRASWFGAAVFAQLPTVYLLARFDASLPVVAVTLTALAAVDLLVSGDRRVAKDLRWLTAGLGALALFGALGASLAAIADDDRGGAFGLLAIAVVAAAAAARTSDDTLRDLLSGSVTPLVAGAAWAAARPELTDAQRPLVLVAVALLSLQVTGLLARARRNGPVVGSLLVAGVALIIEAEPVLTALFGPFSWLGDPWSPHSTEARAALSTDLAWDGTVVTLVVLASAAACALAAGALLDRLDDAAVPAGVLLVATAVLLPLGLATSYNVALALLLAVATVLGALGAWVLGRQRILGIALVSCGVATALLTAVWSVADQDATLTVLPVAAALIAALSVRLPGVLTATAALLAGAELAAYGAAQDLSPEQVGGLLLVAPTACVALSFVLTSAHRLGLESAAAVLGSASVILAVEDPGWLSWTLAATGLLALALALRPDRREIGLAGGLLLSASSWVRLADANVHAPEPYVAPLAVAALLFGHLRRRSDPRVGSFGAYGAGLAVALVPSLIKSFDDETPTRGLLLLVVAAAVVLAGVKDRLRAPLVIGGAVIVLDGLHLLAPYASALPRWTLLAGAGTLLFVVGATYEQRLKDVARLRERYDSWA